MNITEKLYLRKYRNDFGNTQLDSSNSDLTTAKIALMVSVFVMCNVIAVMAIVFVSMGRKEKPKSKRLERLKVEVETALERIPKIIKHVDFNGDGKLCQGETTNLFIATYCTMYIISDWMESVTELIRKWMVKNPDEATRSRVHLSSRIRSLYLDLAIQWVHHLDYYVV